MPALSGPMTSTVDTGSALTFEVQQPIMLGYGTAARIAAQASRAVQACNLRAQRVVTAANTQTTHNVFDPLECLSALALVTGSKK